MTHPLLARLIALSLPSEAPAKGSADEIARRVIVQPLHWGLLYALASPAGRQAGRPVFSYWVVGSFAGCTGVTPVSKGWSTDYFAC
mmetsp:Transcript_31826/g.69648  ORF Transcript_31826/g.69648 Transcript_31826/m.69648 type:complete len:86 (-) Transcript_31826:39-296(-)